MEYRLKGLSDAACKNIRAIGKYKPYERNSDRNDCIMQLLLKKLTKKEINSIRLKDDEKFIFIHRSTRPGIMIQYSVGWIKKGIVEPSYHVNVNSFSDLKREGYPTGVWVTE